MANSKNRRNKPYRPRLVDPSGGLVAIGAHLLAAEDAQPIAADDQDDLHLAYRLAFNIMRNGPSTEETWGILTVSLNIALILSERGLGSDYEAYIVKALDGQVRAWSRAQKVGVWRYDGDAINDIALALEVHDEQVRLATKAEIREALEEVNRRVAQGNVYRMAA